MKISELVNSVHAEVLCGENLEKDVESGFVCDLLSWVMARGKENMGWITVQTHLNVIAVAALHSMSCVILPENLKMEEAVLNKAKEEGICVISSPLSSFEIAGLMYEQLK